MVSKILFFAIVAGFCIKPIKSFSQVSVQDSLALVDFYDSTYGVSPWQFGQSWDLQNPVNTWSGIGSIDRVFTIRIWGGGIGGKIPSSFGNLTALQSIEFLDFGLSATLPESFENLINLKTVYFHAVFGPDALQFPAALTKVPNLESIDMEDNYFTDSLPASFGSMTKLGSLNLFQNSLSGSIPYSINNLDSLKYMDISGNRYTFKDIVPFVSDYLNLHKTYVLHYSPQLNIPIHRFNNKLAVSAGDVLNDTFNWYKDSALVATITGDSTYTPSDTGRYYVAVTNSIATDLTLYGDEFTLHFIMPDSAVIASQNISGTSPVNMSDGIFEIVNLQPAAGANQLSGDVTAAVNIDPSVSTYHSQPYVQRHYDITPAVNAANAQAIVTLYFTQQDFDNYNEYVTANNLSLPFLPSGGVDNGNVRITQFHGNFAGSSRPENYSNPNVVLIVPTVAWDNAEQWWTVTFPVTGFSGFFLSTANTTLPITLISFSAKQESNSVFLQWQTANEANAKEFVIQRDNGNGFIDVGRISANSITIANAYNFTDVTPYIGSNIYRLKMIDEDGRFTFSNSIRINFEATSKVLKVYPNPVSSILHLTVSSKKNETIFLKIVDLSGKIVLQEALTVTKGLDQFQLKIDRLSPGVYYISGRLNGRKERLSFVKQ
jgi:Secretion system C-terminal sorting domain/Leucine rich repeat